MINEEARKFPSTMDAVATPPGTKMYQIDSKSVSHAFGVQAILHGDIRTFGEPEAPEYVEGTFIEYQPGTVYAHVARRGLSADEINRIGDICADVDTDVFKLSFFPNVIDQTEKLGDNLEILGYSRSTSQDQLEKLDEETQRTIEQLGILLARLKHQKTAVGDNYERLLKEADALGVTLIETHTGSVKGTGKTTIPVKLYFKKDSSTQTSKE